MKQTYIGNNKINKLYKGNELWCNWNSGGIIDTPETPIDIIKHFDEGILFGNWSDSSLKGYNNTTTKYSKINDSTCTCTFNVPLTSNYNVYVWYPYHTSNGKSCEYSIITSNKTYTVKLSQLENGDKWRKLVIVNGTEESSITVKIKVTHSSNTRINCVRIESTTEAVTTETFIQELGSIIEPGEMNVIGGLYNE